MPETKCGYQLKVSLYYGVPAMLEAIDKKDKAVAYWLKEGLKNEIVTTSGVYSAFLKLHTLLEIFEITKNWEEQKAHKMPSRHRHS